MASAKIDEKTTGHSYFNMTENFSADVSAFVKWTGMRTRYKTQEGRDRSQCDRVSFYPCAGLAERDALIARLRNRALTEQLQRVNDFSNASPYTEDAINWAMEDYWETPFEFLTVSGDCEDYAISKYYLLRALGVPAAKMRIIIVQDLNLGGVIHAILGIYAGNDLYILDNQIKQVIEAERIYHYRPIYGINEEGWWAYHPK